MPEPFESELPVTGLRSLIDRSLKSSTFINTFWLGSSSITNGVLGAFASAILARSLGVTDFGVLTLVITMMNLMIDSADLGMTSTFVRFGSESVASGDSVRFQGVLTVMLRYKLLLGTLVVGLALVLIKPVVELSFGHVDDRISSYFLLSLIPVSLTIAASIYYPILQSYKNFRLHSLLSIIRFGSKLILIVAVFGIVGGLSISWGIWAEIASVLLFLMLNVWYSPVKRYSLTINNKELQHEILSFNKWLLIYQLITLASSRVDIFFVGGFSTTHDLGLYSAASKIIGLVIAATNSYYAVLLAEIASVASEGAIELRRRRARKHVLLMVASMPVLALLADVAIRVIFGSAYTGAGTILQIMCVGVAFTVLAYPVNAALYAHNRSEVFPMIGGVTAVSIIFGNLYLIPRFGGIGAAAMFSAGAFISWCVSSGYYALKRTSLTKAV